MDIEVLIAKSVCPQNVSLFKYRAVEDAIKMRL